jgi:hypothetical protein
MVKLINLEVVMLVVTGTFEDERFIPDKPVSIPQKKRVVVVEEIIAQC